MASLMQLLGDRPCRFTDNKLRWKNQWRYFSCAFYHRNEPLYGPTPHSHAVLPHSRKWRNSILTEFNIIKANQGNIIWNTQPVFCERTKNTNSHEIAPSNNGGKVATLC